MWPFRSKESKRTIPGWAAAAIVISTISMAASIGVARWSWLLVEEQISLRQDFMNLKTSQEQLGIQYEFWNKQLQKEREEIKKLR